jgi:hypothetical protein
MSDELEQSLLAINTKSFRRAPLTEEEAALVRRSLGEAPIKHRVLACISGFLSEDSELRDSSIKHLETSCNNADQSDAELMCYLTEAIMILTRKRVFGSAFLNCAIRAMSTGDSRCQVNASNALSRYARTGDPDAIRVLRLFTDSEDPAIRANARLGLKVEPPGSDPNGG